MNGEQLYVIYQEALAEFNSSADVWDYLDIEDQEIWTIFAAKIEEYKNGN